VDDVQAQLGTLFVRTCPSNSRPRRAPAVISSAWMNTTPNFHQSSDAIASWFK